MILTKVFEWQNNNCNYGTSLRGPQATRVSATIIICHGINMRLNIYRFPRRRRDAMRNRRDFVSIPYYTIPYVPILAQIYGLNYAPAECAPQFQFQFWIRFRFRLRFLGSANAVKIMVMVATRESRNFMIIWRGQPNISRMLMALSGVIAD